MSSGSPTGWPRLARTPARPGSPRPALARRAVLVAVPGPAVAGPAGASPGSGLDDLRVMLAQALGSDHVAPTSGDPARGRGGARVDDVVDPRVVALVELAGQGDVEAFGQLYEMYVTAVYRYAYVRTGTREAAEDITSETFIRALARIGTFTWQGRDIGAWFITIARNLLTDRAKSSRFRLEVTTADLLETTDQSHHASGPGPEETALLRSRDQRLVEAIRRLTPDQAECLVLRFLHGLSLAECAQVLGRKENAVKQLQLRAVRSLRKELGDAPF